MKYFELIRGQCSASGIGGNRAAELRAIGELADAEIAALKAECERLREALGFVADHSTEPSIVRRVDSALLGQGELF